MTKKPLPISIASELPDSVAGCHALIGELLQRLAELEERLKLNSRNSSKPPSSDGPGSGGNARPSKPKSGRKRGAQPGHKGHHRAMVEASSPDHIVDCPAPDVCDCGGLLHPHGKPLRHQVFELPPLRPIVTEYRRHGGVCGQCGRHVLGALPPDVGNGQLGVRSVALVGTLAAQFHLSQQKIQTLLQQVFRLKFSLGTISAAHGTVADALAPVCEEMHDAIRQETVKYADETTHQSHSHLLWLWAMVCSWGAVFQIQASRGQLAAKALLGKEIEGILVSDRYVGYNWVDLAQRQICWSHLLRDFQRIAGREGLPGALGRSLLAMGLLMFRYRHEEREREAYVSLQARIKRVLMHSADQSECSRTANTCANLLKLWPALWRFLDNEEVEPTNNQAERAIRSVVIRRKISYVTRSGRGLRFVERAFAVAYTCGRQGKVFFDTLCESISAAFSDQPAPSLVPLAD